MARHDPDVRRAAVAILAAGTMTLAEVAELAGVSHNVVRYWARAAGVNWQRARETRNVTAWRREIERGSRLAERPNPKRKRSPSE